MQKAGARPSVMMSNWLLIKKYKRRGRKGALQKAGMDVSFSQGECVWAGCTLTNTSLLSCIKKIVMFHVFVAWPLLDNSV